MRTNRGSKSKFLPPCFFFFIVVLGLVAYSQLSVHHGIQQPLNFVRAVRQGQIRDPAAPDTMPAPLVKEAPLRLPLKMPPPLALPLNPTPVAEKPPVVRKDHAAEGPVVAAVRNATPLAPNPAAPIAHRDPAVTAAPKGPPFPTDPAKPILYLIQAEGTQAIPEMGGSDRLCITWKHQQPICDHLPGSSWTQGRNHMWKKAVDMPKKYMYYIFMDEDITLSNLTLFEQTLLAWQPPVAVPAGIAQLTDEAKLLGREALILWRYDAAFNAFHYDVIHNSLVLPYGDVFDSFSWWLNQLYVSYLSQIFYPDQVLGFMKVTTWNHFHRAYPRGWNHTAIHEFFETQIVPDPHIRKNMKGAWWLHSGDAKVKPTGIQRYLLPDQYLKLLDLDTIWWRRVREIRASADGMPPKRSFGIAFTGEDHQQKFGITNPVKAAGA